MLVALSFLQNPSLILFSYCCQDGSMMWASQDYAAEAAADIEDQGIEEDLETDAEGSALPGATSKAEEGMPAQIDIATHD